MRTGVSFTSPYYHSYTMALQTGTDKARARTMSIGGNGQAAVWLEVGSQIILHGKWSSPDAGGGSTESHWQRCIESGCLGSAIDSGEYCYRHAAESQRDYHLQHAFSGQCSLDLRGTEIDEPLWIELLRKLLGQKDAIVVPIDCSASVFSSKMRLRDLTFTRPVGFFGAVFDDGCEVRNCNFDGGLDIRFASFRLGPGYFFNCKSTTLGASYCSTQQHIAFSSCKFTDEVEAVGVQKDFRLEDCHLSKLFDLSRADVYVLILRGSRLDGEMKIVDFCAKSMMSDGIEI